MTTEQDNANIKAIAQTAEAVSGLGTEGTVSAITTYKDSVGVTPLPADWNDLTIPTGEARTAVTIVGHGSLPDITP